MRGILSGNRREAMRPLIACLRLARVAAHLVWGLALCIWVLPKQPPLAVAAARMKWSQQLLRMLGVRVVSHGKPGQACFIAANHISWLDVFVIHALTPATFVCKSEVKDWPLIGPLVKRSGTLFIERGKPRAAAAAVDAVANELQRGHSVAVFPEGTTTGGDTVLPFRSALIEGAIDARAPLQPVAIHYNQRAPVYVGDTTIMHSLYEIAKAHDLVATAHFLPTVDTAHTARGLLAENTRTRILRHLPTDSHSASSQRGWLTENA